MNNVCNDDETIPVALATDKNYVPYLGVAVHSIIDNASPNGKYHIYILGQGLSHENVVELESLGRPHAHVEVVDVTEIMSKYGYEYNNNHLTQGCSIRLSLEVLYESGTVLSTYKKLLYIDSDVVVLRDVAELYREDLGDCILGAVRGYVTEGMVSNMMINFPLHNGARDYFNSGVLLINMPRFCKMNIGTQGLLMLQQDKKQVFFTRDQDVLNILCEGHVKFLDVKWNYEWMYAFPWRHPATMEGRRGIHNKKDIGVIHYNSCCKPWNSKGYFGGSVFWEYARQTRFVEEVIDVYLNTDIIACEIKDINEGRRNEAINEADIEAVLNEYKLLKDILNSDRTLFEKFRYIYSKAFIKDMLYLYHNMPSLNFRRYTGKVAAFLSVLHDESMIDYYGLTPQERKYVISIMYENCVEDGLEGKNSCINGGYLFPYHMFSEGSRVVIYGAGDVGRTFYQQVIHDQYVKIVGLIDKTVEKLDEIEIRISSVEKLRSMEYDYILIAIQSHSEAEEIKKYLINLGINEEKIKWDGKNYLRDEFYHNIYFPVLRTWSDNCII